MAAHTHKRPLGAVAPEQEQEQEAARSPRKRLRRAGLLVMWLEKGKARVVTVGQMAQMLRQAQHDVANSVMERLPNILERILGHHFAAFQSSSIMGCIEDKVQSIVKTEMQEQQAASLPSGVFEPPRQISEGVPETGGITRVKLRFVNVDRPEDTLYTCCPVQWHNGENVKVAIFENDRQITEGHLSKLQIEILAVYADFFTERGQADFTTEEFSKQICMCNGKESVLKTVNLTNGECSLGSVTFTESSQRKNLRLAARVKRQNLVVRVQEAFTDPFVVKDRRSIFNEKSTTPSKEDAVHQLKGISPKGKRCEKLASKNITKVKHLLRHYHKDNFGLQKLIGMKKRAWNTMIEHATDSLPGDEIYSYWVPEDNCEILFNVFYDLVGKMSDDYVPYSVNDVDQFPQRKVNNWKKSAYKKFDERESSGGLTPDYFMNNGRPVRAVPLNNDAGPSVQGLGQHNTSMPQNGTSDYQPQGNVLNDQGSFSAQPTIPSHILVPAPVTGARQTGQQNGYLCFSTTDAPVTSYPVADAAGTSSDGVSLGTSSLNHVPVDMSSGPPSDEFDDWLDELLAAGEYEAEPGHRTN